MPNELEVRKYAKFAIKEVSQFAKTFYGFDDSWILDNDIVFLQYNGFSEKNGSWGGRDSCVGSQKPRPFVKMNFRGVVCGDWSVFNEYDHISEDSEIGTLVCRTWEEFVLVVVCHEIAHAVEFSHSFYGVEIDPEPTCYVLKKEPNSHAALWQMIYRTLRNHFVNHASEIIQLPKVAAAEIQTAGVLAKVIIKHGFVDRKFVSGVFDLLSVYEPTEEALTNQDKFGIKVDDGFLVVKTPEGVKKVRVKVRDYEVVERYVPAPKVINVETNATVLNGFPVKIKAKVHPVDHLVGLFKAKVEKVELFTKKNWPADFLELTVIDQDLVNDAVLSSVK